jgi:acetyltransferase-like isoleucine patch superfamily enzyme
VPDERIEVSASQTTPEETYSHREWLKRLRAKGKFFVSRSHWRNQGRNNQLNYHDALLHRCSIEMIGEGNTLEILPGTRAWHVTFRLVGNGLFCRVGANSRLHGGHYILEDNGSRLEVGSGCTLYAPMCVVQEGGAIRIGDHCMLANGTDLRNGDGHSILDTTTRARINPARDILIEDHVWVGAYCQILKGVTLHAHSIVGARSVVTKDVAPHSLVGGVPANTLRANVEWDGRRL